MPAIALAGLNRAAFHRPGLLVPVTLETMRLDYVRTARSKGLLERVGFNTAYSQEFTYSCGYCGRGRNLPLWSPARLSSKLSLVSPVSGAFSFRAVFAP